MCDGMGVFGKFFVGVFDLGVGEFFWFVDVFVVGFCGLYVSFGVFVDLFLFEFGKNGELFIEYMVYSCGCVDFLCNGLEIDFVLFEIV